MGSVDSAVTCAKYKKKLFPCPLKMMYDLESLFARPEDLTQMATQLQANVWIHSVLNYILLHYQ